ncbi:MAG: HAMP domain-containing sensor histidine kinase [Polyangiaceae bacterium]
MPNRSPNAPRAHALGPTLRGRARAVRPNSESTGEVGAKREALSPERGEHTRELARFAARVGNELNNPLAGILAAHQFIRHRVESTPELVNDWRMKQFMDLIEREVENASRVVEDLVDFGVRRPCVRTQFLLRPLVEDIVKAMRRGPRTIVENRCDDTVVHLDREKLGRALSRVIQNAVEAIPPDAPGLVTIETIERPHELRIEISDDGTGIPPDVVAQMMKPFFSTKVKGNGLGLTLARELAAQQGGTLSFRAREPHAGEQEARGAVFSFVFTTA